jgi:hypothetical protein
MANQHYEILLEETHEFNGVIHTIQDYNVTLVEFLNNNAGKYLFIYQPSLDTNNIRAIVLEN